ncbi:hypothetical protein FKV25_02270 [Lysobacter aestuarii]|uniref:Uncharacterized protein n=1 Tax=Marilutibacter aestuarii TaxID=1706195 RepID=A0A508ANR1_9GAMM|nr:hypothetical protein FKV25_02270 [Lysobacter aestuarii]
MRLVHRLLSLRSLASSSPRKRGSSFCVQPSPRGIWRDPQGAISAAHCTAQGPAAARDDSQSTGSLRAATLKPGPGCASLTGAARCAKQDRSCVAAGSDGGYRLRLDPPYEATRRVAVAVAVAVELDLDLDLRDFEAAEHRRAWRPKRRPCLSKASLGAVPPWPRSTGHRCGEAGPAADGARGFGSF